MPTYIENRQLVTPGDLIADGNYIAGENTYKENGKVYATHVGLVQHNQRRLSVVALKAFYIPKIGDTVIGKVTDVTLGGWILDLNAPYSGMLRG